MNGLRRCYRRSCCWTILASAWAGCVQPWAYRADIASDDANERILAVRQAGERKDWGAVPLLVDRLEDEDAAVRFYAILALERITGERFGYEYAEPSPRRADAVVRWRTYIRRGEHLTAAKQTEPQSRGATDGMPDL